MSIAFDCPECDDSLNVKSELAGRNIKCPKCGERIRVPADDEPERPKKRKAAPASVDDGDEKKRPRRRKKKAKKAGMSMGLLLGLVGGGVVVLIAGAVVLVIAMRGVNSTEPGPLGIGSNGKTLTKQVGAGEIKEFTINCDEGQDMVVIIKTELSDPATRFEAWVEIMDLITTKSTRLASGGGTDCRLAWKSPGFGSLDVTLRNYGPGTATCKISHNGM